MNQPLSPDEERLLRELLADQKRSIRSFAVSANFLLVFGGLLIILAAFYILQHRTDDSVFVVGIPNFVGGVLCFIAYLLLSRRAEHNKRFSALLTKLANLTKVAS